MAGCTTRRGRRPRQLTSLRQRRVCSRSELRHGQPRPHLCRGSSQCPHLRRGCSPQSWVRCSRPSEHALVATAREGAEEERAATAEAGVPAKGAEAPQHMQQHNLIPCRRRSVRLEAAARSSAAMRQYPLAPCSLAARIRSSIRWPSRHIHSRHLPWPCSMATGCPRPNRRLPRPASCQARSCQAPS